MNEYIINNDLLNIYFKKKNKLNLLKILFNIFSLIILAILVIFLYDHPLLCSILFFIILSTCLIISILFIGNIHIVAKKKYSLIYQVLSGISHERETVFTNKSIVIQDGIEYVALTSNDYTYYIFSELSKDIMLNKEYKIKYVNDYLIGINYEE